jgi:phospholipid/cholesterol/gamma-HCH transport system substrate-binding protein
MQARFKFRHVNELTGLFVIAVFALVVAGLVFSGHSQRWFSRKYSFDVLLPEAGTSGLRRGDEVFILGVSAGLVDDVIVGDDGRVKARVKIRRDFERLVRVDSSASIKKAFAVAGDSFMEISRGTGARLPDQAPSITCLPSEDSLDRMEKMLAGLSSELIPVVKRVGAGVDEWTKLGADLQKSQQQASALVRRLDNLAAGLEEGKGTAGKLLGDSALADEAQTLLARANQTMNQLQVMVTNLSAAVKDVQMGTARVPEIVDAVARETKDLPGLVALTQTSMRELERLVEALQRHWMVRKYVNKSDPPPRKLSGLPASEEPPPGKVQNAARSPKDAKR